MTGNIYQSIPAPGLWADLILVVHALIVCFVIVGQLLILAGWWQSWAWVVLTVSLLSRHSAFVCQCLWQGADALV
jgi:hypothetical protein